MCELALPEPAATDRLGARLFEWAAALAADAPRGLLITLDGPLGAGKSSLARALLRAAGVRGPIPSPTFTLVEPYEAAGIAFFHLDLYRLADVGELHLLDYEDMRAPGRVVLMEWAGRFPELVAQADLAVTLAYDGQARRATLRSRRAAAPRLD